MSNIEQSIESIIGKWQLENGIQLRLEHFIELRKAFVQFHDDTLDMAIEALPTKVKIGKYVDLEYGDKEYREKLEDLKIKL